MYTQKMYVTHFTKTCNYNKTNNNIKKYTELKQGHNILKGLMHIY